MRAKRDGTLAAWVLRQLAQAPGGLCTPDLLTAEFLNAHAGQRDPRQRSLTHLGAALRNLEAAKMVKRTGRSAGGWQNGPAQRWAITEKGLGQVAYWAVVPSPQTMREQRAAALKQKRARAAATIESCAQAYGPWTPRPGRRAAAARLRAAGCSLQQIGDLFGVTREMIRQDLLPPSRSGNE
jgi:hypothetical protein